MKPTRRSAPPGLSRRRLLAAGAAALAGPMIVPASALGRGRPAPSDRITMGCIGLGMQGTPNMGNFLGNADCQVVTVCDIDGQHLQDALNQVNSHYNNKDCHATSEFMETCTDPKIDALSIAVPDHWHALVAVMGLRNGKDVYGEKPLAHTVAEGRAICNAVAEYERIWQTGSWQRSIANFRQGTELVLNGYIGRILRVEVGLPSGTTDFAGTLGKDQISPPPAYLDYNRWLGPAPWAPYCPMRVHRNWRWNLDYGGGQLTDWIGHHCDIAHWGMGMEYTGPSEIQGHGDYIQDNPVWNSATRFRLTAQYPKGIEMTIAGGYPDIRSGAKWIGTDGWVWVDRGGFDAYPRELLKLADAPKKINLYRSPGHHREFLDSVKSRRQTLAPAEVAQRSCTPGNLGQVAMILGRKLRWNPDTEQIIGDPVASRMLERPMRQPWILT